MIHEIEVKSAIHRHEHFYATPCDLNCYRGCGHRCAYCFARYTHSYLESKDFFNDIWVKTNLPAALEKDFSKKSWRPTVVNASGVTDPYQPLEEHYQLMPSVIEQFIKHKNPLIITTKSKLVQRDLPLLVQLNQVAHICLRISIMTLDETLRVTLEPGASPIKERFETLYRFAKAGIETQLLLMPIIPYLTDSLKNIESIFQEAKRCLVKAIWAAPLHLRGHTRDHFLDVIQHKFPQYLDSFVALYPGSYLPKTYTQSLHKKISILRKKYHFFNPESSPVISNFESNSSKQQQLELFSYPNRRYH